MIGFFPGLLVVSGAIYIALVLALRLGLGRIRAGRSASQPSVAVVIAARNEAANIGTCLAHLAAQDYPPELMQVVVVDDGSEDDTRAQAEKWQDRLPGLCVIDAGAPRYRCRKKSAVDAGIRATTGDLIFTTDADCRPRPGWVSGLVRMFEPEVGMVAGHAPLVPKKGILQRMLSLQSDVVSTLSAGSVGLGFPLTCTGRNLAYRRTAFHQAGGFDPIGSVIGGDDVLLMRRISHHTPYAVRFCAEPSARVPSAAHQSGQFRRQVRYQSKTTHAGAVVLILAVCVYIFHLALAAGPVFAWFREDLWQLLGLLLALRFTADGTLLWGALGLFGARPRLAWLPVLELVCIPYVVLFFALGAMGTRRWN